MNHPDWRQYQRAMVASQLKAGHDGILFVGIRRLSSIDDEVIPVGEISLKLRLPMKVIKNARLLTADAAPTSQDQLVERKPDDAGSVVRMRIVRLQISALVVVEGELGRKPRRD